MWVCKSNGIQRKSERESTHFEAKSDLNPQAHEEDSAYKPGSLVLRERVSPVELISSSGRLDIYIHTQMVMYVVAWR